MPRYTYHAADTAGTVIKEQASASDPTALERRLERGGKFLVEVLKEEREKKEKRSRGARGVKRRDLIEMAYHISVMTSSGLPLVTGLQDFAEGRASPALRGVLREVLRDVNEGALLSEAMTRFESVFGNIFVNLVRAGESSGSLDTVMERFYQEMEWQDKIRGRLVQALVYPAFLFLALAGLVVLLLTFLLPRVMGLFPKGMELPLPTRVLIAASETLQVYWMPLIAAAVLLPVVIKLARHTKRGRYLVDDLLMHLPLIGGVVKDIGVARFLSTFRTLYSSGVEIMQSLRISGESAGNAVITARADKIRLRIMEGALLSEAFAGVREFNSLVKNLIHMSEKTGKTAEALERITRYFDTVIPRRVKRMIAVMEPAVILGAGLVVGFVLAGTLLPIFNLYSVM